jgi:hypothetical protein
LESDSIHDIIHFVFYYFSQSVYPLTIAPHRVPFPVVAEVQCGLPMENTDRNRASRFPSRYLVQHVHTRISLPLSLVDLDTSLQGRGRVTTRAKSNVGTINDILNTIESTVGRPYCFYPKQRLRIPVKFTATRLVFLWKDKK